VKTSFDTAANNYDNSFTNTIIGKIQRELVYECVTKHLPENQKILEINCGTGEDALWFSKNGHEIFATDISSKMIAVAKNKKEANNIEFKPLDINEMGNSISPNSFDIIFSNFGGLNCLSEIELLYFFQNSIDILKPNGKIMLVVMPKNALWERLYFIAKFNFKAVFRRLKKSTLANVDGEVVPTYYYNPKRIKKIANHPYDFCAQYPIGFFIPPSYLEPFIKRHALILSILNYLEKKIKRLSFLAKFSDHYLIIFQKK
jgi:ubiquinone/menaquinone biosynthesis C-methylase UbiE